MIILPSIVNYSSLPGDSSLLVGGVYNRSNDSLIKNMYCAANIGTNGVLCALLDTNICNGKVILYAGDGTINSQPLQMAYSSETGTSPNTISRLPDYTYRKNGTVYYYALATGVFAGPDYNSGISTRYYKYDTTDYDASVEECLESIFGGGVNYPITYRYTNSTVSGSSEAAVGDTVTVSAVPNNNYGITDPASQILVTNNDVAVPYQWNPSTNTITFTMPDPT